MCSYMILLSLIFIFYHVEKFTRAIVALMTIYIVLNIAYLTASFLVPDSSKTNEDYYDIVQFGFIMNESLYIYTTCLL